MQETIERDSLTIKARKLILSSGDLSILSTQNSTFGAGTAFTLENSGPVGTTGAAIQNVTQYRVVSTKQLANQVTISITNVAGSLITIGVTRIDLIINYSLPAGFKPLTLIRLPAIMETSTTNVHVACLIQIDTNGDISIRKADGSNFTVGETFNFYGATAAFYVA